MQWVHKHKLYSGYINIATEHHLRLMLTQPAIASLLGYPEANGGLPLLQGRPLSVHFTCSRCGQQLVHSRSFISTGRRTALV